MWLRCTPADIASNWLEFKQPCLVVFLGKVEEYRDPDDINLRCYKFLCPTGSVGYRYYDHIHPDNKNFLEAENLERAEEKP